MAGVIEPFTGTDHPIRGVPGGGLPWDIDPRHAACCAATACSSSTSRASCSRAAVPVPADLAGHEPGAAVPRRGELPDARTRRTPARRCMTDPVPADAEQATR